jgi:hypothetical protein
VFDRPLAFSGPAGTVLESLVLLVPGQLRAVDRELLLRKAEPGVRGGQISEEELQQAGIA